ncbi:hypothetical protein D9M68_868010 [compost metagenome]
MTNHHVALQCHFPQELHAPWPACFRNDADAVASFAVRASSDECGLMTMNFGGGSAVGQHSASGRWRIAHHNDFSLHFSLPGSFWWGIVESG